MSRRALAALAAGVVPLIAACAQVPPTATPAPPPQTPMAAPDEATPSPTAPETLPSATPEPPATTTTPIAWPAPSKTPKPSPSASKAPTTAPTKAPEPINPTDQDEACRTESLRYLSKGACAKRAQALLKQAGYFSPTPGTTFGAAAVNWTLSYQRSRGLADNGTFGPETWNALLSNKPKLPEVIPGSCRTSGVVICASKAQNKLYWLKDGQVQKTVPVRFGGWTTDKNGKWRLHPTVNGTYRVYKKHANPPSERYGQGAMPYSTMFDPNMYVHYSAPFAKQGYSGSSHGCVNVKSKADAKWIMDNTPIGAKVVVYSG